MASFLLLRLPASSPPSHASSTPLLPFFLDPLSSLASSRKPTEAFIHHCPVVTVHLFRLLAKRILPPCHPPESTWKQRLALPLTLSPGLRLPACGKEPYVPSPGAGHGEKTKGSCQGVPDEVRGLARPQLIKKDVNSLPGSWPGTTKGVGQTEVPSSVGSALAPPAPGAAPAGE